MVKISLIPGIKQAQGISLTPQLIQSIKLFELNNIDWGFNPVWILPENMNSYAEFFNYHEISSTKFEMY